MSDSIGSRAPTHSYVLCETYIKMTILTISDRKGKKLFFQIVFLLKLYEIAFFSGYFKI